MHPNKKIKVDSHLASDPFDDDDDWDDDDAIFQLVDQEVPTYSQMSQAIKATPINTHSTNGGSSSTKPRSFVFKRPSACASSVVSSKPTRYTNSSNNDSPSIAEKTLGLSEKPLLMQGTNSVVNGAVKVQEEVADATLKLQMTDMVRKQHAHEGEIKWLRLTLKEKDTQINAMRTNFNAEKAKQKLQHSERERGFAKDMESLRSELQFKESELIGVSQALDRLKRSSNKQAPTMKLDSDGFPASSNSFVTNPGTSSVVIKQPKLEPMEATGSLPKESEEEVECDFQPMLHNRLIPRKPSATEFNRKLLISGMLRANMESVKDHVDGCDVTLDTCSRDKCLQLLSDSIACTRDVCYL